MANLQIVTTSDGIRRCGVPRDGSEGSPARNYAHHNKYHMRKGIRESGENP